MEDAQESKVNTQTLRLNRLIETMAGLERLAFYDPITGMPNSNFLQQELERTKNAAQARCLILLGLRNFDHINRKYTLLKGDQYLIGFGKICEEGVRRTEHVIKRRPLINPEVDWHSLDQVDARSKLRGHYGGDEFYVLISGTIDGLAYLNGLQSRSREIEEMSMLILGALHELKFHAGIIGVAPGEGFVTATDRVMQCLLLAQECPTSSLYWPRYELAPPDPGSTGKRY